MSGYVDYKLLGMRLREKRNSCNFTQEQLSERINCTPGYISQLERGVSRPNLDTLANICNVLKCDLSEIISNVNHTASSSSDSDIGIVYDQLSASERKMIFKLINTYIENR